MWTRKKTVIGGTVTGDDWTVLRRGQRVGRVYPLDGGSMMDARYWWGTWTFPAEHGQAPTREAALDAVRQAIRRRWSDSVAMVPSESGG